MPAATTALDSPAAPQLEVKKHEPPAQSPTNPEPDTETGAPDIRWAPPMRAQAYFIPNELDILWDSLMPPLDPGLQGSVLKSRPDVEPSIGNKEHDPAGSDVWSVPLMDAHTIHGASMDSGYATASVRECQNGTLDTQDGDSKVLTSIEVGECDGKTVYSDEGSIAGAELDTYKVELVDNLVNWVRQLEPGPETLESICEVMPMLMKSFALRLGQPGSTKTERDVMYFIHKYRK